MAEIPKLDWNKMILEHYKEELPKVQEYIKIKQEYEVWIIEQIKVYEAKIENTKNHKNAADTSGH
jgi:hypothetical protein